LILTVVPVISAGTCVTPGAARRRPLRDPLNLNDLYRRVINRKQPP